MPRVKMDLPDGPVRLTHGNGEEDTFTVKDGSATLSAERLDRIVNALPVAYVSDDAAAQVADSTA